jgi:hypothetical protein
MIDRAFGLVEKELAEAQKSLARKLQKNNDMQNFGASNAYL